MTGSRPLRWIAAVAAVVLLLAGCDAPDDAAADTTLPATTAADTPTTTPNPPTTTTTAPPTTTEPETTTTTAAATNVASALEAKYPIVVTSGLSGEDTQEIVVWAPDADGSWPVVYALHGTGGDAQGLAELATVLAGQGVVVFAADYRSELMPTQQWQDVYRDTECGYRYARSVASTYGGDLDQPVTIVGHSLGASIALAMGLNEAVFAPAWHLVQMWSCPSRAATTSMRAGHSPSILKHMTSHTTNPNWFSSLGQKTTSVSHGSPRMPQRPLKTAALTPAL